MTSDQPDGALREWGCRDTGACHGEGRAESIVAEHAAAGG